MYRSKLFAVACLLICVFLSAATVGFKRLSAAITGCNRTIERSVDMPAAAQRDELSQQLNKLQVGGVQWRHYGCCYPGRQLRVSDLFFPEKKLTTFFAHHQVSFLLNFARMSTPLQVSPRTFLTYPTSFVHNSL